MNPNEAPPPYSAVTPSQQQQQQQYPQQQYPQQQQQQQQYPQQQQQQQWPQPQAYAQQPPMNGNIPPYQPEPTKVAPNNAPMPQYAPQPSPMENQVFTVALEIWKCNGYGQLHTRGNFIKRKGTIQIRWGETFHQFIARISNIQTAPPGCKLEGRPLAFMAHENAPEVTAIHFNQPIGPMLNLQMPRLIVKYDAGSGRGGWGTAVFF